MQVMTFGRTGAPDNGAVASNADEIRSAVCGFCSEVEQENLVARAGDADDRLDGDAAD